MLDYEKDDVLNYPLQKGVVISRNPLILKEIATTAHFVKMLKGKYESTFCHIDSTYRYNLDGDVRAIATGPDGDDLSL